VLLIGTLIAWSAVSLLAVRLNVPNWLLRAALVGSAIAGVAAVVLVIAGVFMVNARDPRDALREKALSTRNVARGSLLAGCAVIAFGFLAVLNPAMPVVLIGRPRATALVGAALLGVAAWGTLRRLSALMERGGDRVLARRLADAGRFFAWGAPVAALGMVLGGLRLGIPPVSPLMWLLYVLSMLFGCVGGLIAIALVVNVILSAILMLACGHELRRALREAELGASLDNLEADAH
jgi:hypothetical protein